MNDEARELVREKRDSLEHLADSDLPCAWAAETLLDAAGDDETNTT